MIDPQRTAAALRRARRGAPGSGRALLQHLGADIHPETMAEGIAAQLALAGSAPPAGFKIGATARRMQDYLGLRGPAAAFMPESSLHASGSTLAYDGLFRPGVECELAVLLAHDLPPGPCSAERARDATARVMPAIEIVENRYADLAAFGAPAMVADQVFHAAAVIGEAGDAWRSMDLLGLRGTISVDGVLRGEGEGRELLGGPFEALAWLAASAEAAAFGGLRGGQIVMLGSVCPPIWLDGPGVVTASFPPLGAVEISLVATAP